MTVPQVSRRRWLLGGGVLAVAGSLGLAAFPLSNRAGYVSDAVFVLAVFGLALLAAAGVMITVFNLR